VADTDVVLAQIDSLWKIVRLEPNPTLVESFLRRAMTLFGELDRAGRWRDLAAVASTYRQLAHALKPARPDVADAIVNALCAFCNESRAHAVLEQYDRDADGRALATQLIEGFGESLAPGFVALVDDAAMQAKLSSLTLLLCERAAVLAPGLVTRLGGCSVGATRVIVRVCGFAGAGYETAVAGQLKSDDESTVREALRALARIGTARAAALVGSQVQTGSPIAQAAAAEALWHLPQAQMVVQLRSLLQDHEFVGRHPHIASRLIDRAAKTRPAGLEDALEELETLRFRFWNPGLVRVALKARDFRDR
jgi:DNA-binding FadR family transcriptional regulator